MWLPWALQGLLGARIETHLRLTDTAQGTYKCVYIYICTYMTIYYIYIYIIRFLQLRFCECFEPKALTYGRLGYVQ